MRNYLGTVGFFLGMAVTSQGAWALSDDFSTNPLTNPSVIVQGPDAANAATRFTHDAIAGTLTAHYDTSDPTIKLLFPLGTHFTQDQSFTFSASFKIVSAGFSSPSVFSGQLPAFGLINSSTTGSIRASTIDASWNEVTQGNAFDMVTFDYFPTTDTTFGGNSVNLTVLNTMQSGVSFNSSFGTFAYDSETLATDQFLNVTVSYSSITRHALVNWGAGSIDANLSFADFDVDAFAIALWNDPGISATAPAVPSGEPIVGQVIFDSISAQAVPEPASLALLGLGGALLVMRRRK